ncbi:insulinase family protein [Calidifontimicrobium sp. SYSU G02091]|uniref:M16 family metallopeptidase n=1 Tax=Calidifontimicrobium sp. SYSU G02091 TaxID=2926421 RepID=UPI001F539AB4|nr:pitrilysin family protein [Calidifontimicrobium sp. SYSU G02091]MCI1190340.1 insulinase family protein [Calidifontimicrobium sp. SYSU G02091]
MSTPTAAPPACLVTALANGVRVAVLPLPHLATACASVFVRSGSAHEPRALAGIGHVIEHMAFKGTTTRDAQRINLDAERLGAEVLAHTDKDHTAFQMRGLAEHALDFVRMLGDIVRHPTFPADELERERQVLLHEFAEVEDDPMDAAYRLFDHACFGLHPAAQPVIGTRAHVERLTRADLLGFVRRQYTGANVVVGVAGAVDADAVVRAVDAAFSDMPAGTPHTVAPPAYRGDVRAKALAGSGQAHVLIGGALPPLAAGDDAGTVAAAVLGEGMSSPLLQRVREQRPLAYHATCAADVLDVSGQFVVEASTSAALLDDFVHEVAALLRRHAERVDAIDLDRARHQLRVKRLRALEAPLQRLEEAALDLFAFGRVRELDEVLARIDAVDAAQVRATFERLLADGLSAVAVGSVGRAAGERLRRALAR